MGSRSAGTRSKAVAKASYDRLSRWYDLIAGWSERRAVECGLKQLRALEGETVLEIGYGTGRSIVALAQAVGEGGRAIGIDLSESMRRVASSRLRKAGLSDRVELICGDAASLVAELQRKAASPRSLASPEKAAGLLSPSNPEGLPDAIFMSFTLELFDTPEIPTVLHECRRVLRRGGRIAVVAMLKKSERGVMVRLYEWAHEKIPKVVDCRPIDADRALAEAGFQVTQRHEMRMWGLPVSITQATRLTSVSDSLEAQ